MKFAKRQFAAASLLLVLISACSHTREVKTQAYAQLQDHKTFEYDFPAVWKGIETAMQAYKITDRDPNKVDAIEMRKLDKRTLGTDWIYGRSTTKYVEYKVNGFPRTQYLQTRIQYKVTAKSVMGGVEVDVQANEEIEKLKDDGSSAGYQSADEPESSRANDVLEKINLSILAAPNT